MAALYRAIVFPAEITEMTTEATAMTAKTVTRSGPAGLAMTGKRLIVTMIQDALSMRPV